jgi:hypothetical protein
MSDSEGERERYWSWLGSPQNVSLTQEDVWRVVEQLRSEKALENRTVFVGYPYKLPKDDYRGVFAEVGRSTASRSSSPTSS